MAETRKSAPSTLSQPSRKGKKAWRKNVDLRKVEEGLDTVREEIIQGGVIAEKPSDELFTLDTTGDADIAKRSSSKKLLKADEILAQRSAIPGLPGRKRPSEDPHTRSEGAKKPRNGTYVSYRELQRLRRVADNATDVSARIDHTPATHDLWAASPTPDDASQFDFLEPPKARREPKTLKQAPAPLTRSGRPVAHVRKPDAGKSYNPQVGDWSALLQREGAAAVAAEKARLAEEAAEEAKQARLEAEAAKVDAAEKAALAADGEYESGWESEWDGIASETDGPVVHTRKAKGRKTQAERNKTKARKERAAREEGERKQRVREAEERRIADIAKSVATVAQARLLASLARRMPLGELSEDSDENEDGEVQLQRSRFGLARVPEAPLEVTLPDELQDSLRRLKPEGNLLTDRYRNLLINGKLEVRRRAPERRKKKTFRTEKWSYKDWELK